MSEQLNGFIEAQHAQNLLTAGALARIEESLKNTNQRLLGGDGQQGAIPYMNEKVEKVVTRVGKLELWKTGTVKWVAGAVAVLVFEGGALGFYFTHIAGKVQNLADAIKSAH